LAHSFSSCELLPNDKLSQIASQQSAAYQSASPFAHGVYDDVFSEQVLDAIVGEFDLIDSDWREFDSKYELKKQMNQDDQLGEVARSFIHRLNSEPFLRFLENLTGISGLISDPYLEGGGLHRIQRNGKLGIHVDFNKHSVMKVYRRINVLVYLNRDWKDEWGGHFELWENDRDGAVKRVLPIFNRMAIFNTTSTSFHGHPEPLNCPDDVSRKSIALYYYTADDCGVQSKDAHSTLFLNKQGETEEIVAHQSLLSRIKKKFKSVVG